MIESIVVGAVATNCWILSLSKNDCAIIDPGGDAAAILSRIKKLQLCPQLILLTHGHFDHIGALPELWAEYPEVEIAIHGEDAGYLGPLSLAVHRRDFICIGAEGYVDAYWKESPNPTRLIAEGDRIGPFTVLHLPGHTRGSVAFYEAEKGELFSGDTLFAGGVGRTDLPGGDQSALEGSLKRLLQMDGEIRVRPGHGNDTRIHLERR
ncbi:MBL fold metallo-hydrolase [Treponema sp.]